MYIYHYVKCFLLGQDSKFCKTFCNLSFIAFFLSAITFASATTIKETKPAKIRDFSTAKDLILAIKFVSPPFQQIDKNGKPFGLFVDMARDLAKHMDRTFEPVDLHWDGMVSGVRSGHYDIMVVPESHVPQAIFDFSIPFMEVDSVILTRKGYNFKGLESMNDPKIRISMGAKGYDEEIVRRNFPKAQRIALPEGQTPVLELIQGKVDFAVFGPSSALKYSRNYPGQLDVHFERVGRLSMSIAIRNNNNNKEILNTINDFLTNYIKKGKIERLVKKYLHNIDKEYQKYGTKFDTSVGQKWRFDT